MSLEGLPLDVLGHIVTYAGARGCRYLRACVPPASNVGRACATEGVWRAHCDNEGPTDVVLALARRAYLQYHFRLFCLRRSEGGVGDGEGDGETDPNLAPYKALDDAIIGACAAVAPVFDTAWLSLSSRVRGEYATSADTLHSFVWSVRCFVIREAERNGARVAVKGEEGFKEGDGDDDDGAASDDPPAAAAQRETFEEWAAFYASVASTFACRSPEETAFLYVCHGLLTPEAMTTANPLPRQRANMSAATQGDLEGSAALARAERSPHLLGAMVGTWAALETYALHFCHPAVLRTLALPPLGAPPPLEALRRDCPWRHSGVGPAASSWVAAHWPQMRDPAAVCATTLFFKLSDGQSQAYHALEERGDTLVLDTAVERHMFDLVQRSGLLCRSRAARPPFAAMEPSHISIMGAADHYGTVSGPHFYARSVPLRACVRFPEIIALGADELGGIGVQAHARGAGTTDAACGAVIDIRSSQVLSPSIPLYLYEHAAALVVAGTLAPHPAVGYIDRFPRPPPLGAHGCGGGRGCSVAVTAGVEITCAPLLFGFHNGQAMFTYRIGMRLLPTAAFAAVQLRSRHWVIREPDVARPGPGSAPGPGAVPPIPPPSQWVVRDEVQGEGVIGLYPMLCRQSDAEARLTSPCGPPPWLGRDLSADEVEMLTDEHHYFTYASRTSFAVDEHGAARGSMGGSFIFVPVSELDAACGEAFEVAIEPFICVFEGSVQNVQPSA